jgi:hypothetical protein
MLTQIIVNLILIVGIVTVWMRLSRPQKDDPRLSRGLQLLQSKISVLEDLSDRTDRQVDQLTKLLDNKTRQIQKKFLEAEKHIQKLKSSMDRSMEVASIFQDKIPHDEIIERQNTIKHVQAARMANQGYSVDDILAEISLPREQVEFIAKVNKDQLMFDESQLPPWVQSPGEAHKASQMNVSDETDGDQDDQDLELLSVDASQSFAEKAPQYDSLKKLGEEFRQACQSFDETESVEDANSNWEGVEKVKDSITSNAAFQKAKGMTNAILKGVTETLNSQAIVEPSELQEVEAEPAQQSSDIAIVPSEPQKFGKKKQIVKDIEIKKVVFPQIDVTDNLS